MPAYRAQRLPWSVNITLKGGEERFDFARFVNCFHGASNSGHTPATAAGAAAAVPLNVTAFKMLSAVVRWLCSIPIFV